MKAQFLLILSLVLAADKWMTITDPKVDYSSLKIKMGALRPP